MRPGFRCRWNAEEGALVTTSRWRGLGWRRFDADPGCARAVRDWIGHAVGSGQCPADPADAALVASELFGNAVTHGPSGGRVLAGYFLWPRGARITVCDGGGRTAPALREASSLSEGGRGLQVVDALSASWGSFRAAQAQAVWSDLGQPLRLVADDVWVRLVLAEFGGATPPDPSLAATPGTATYA
jgi:hypothetical protein